MGNSKKNTSIILIFGASGSGKTTLLNELNVLQKYISINEKATTRPPKKYDSSEIKCIDEIDRNIYPYVYQQYSFEYGVNKLQIEKAIQDNKDHFIICNDIETIKTLKKDYKEKIKTLFLLFDAPRSHIELVQKSRGISDDQIDLRLAKISVLSELFIDNSQLFDGVILNRLGAPFSEMLYQVENIIGKNYSSSTKKTPAIDKIIMQDMIHIINTIRTNLYERSTNYKQILQPNYVFIIMAMIKHDPQLEDIHNAIKRACIYSGLRAERVDDISYVGGITDKVIGSIKCAQFIIADLTHSRPNVYYELGYAHALKKKVLLTAKVGTKPHFDIQGEKIIFYDNTSMLEREIKRFFEGYDSPE